MKKHLKIVLLSMVSLIALRAWAQAVVVADFDAAKPTVFQFKDELGTVLNAGSADTESGQGMAYRIKYDTVKKGWAGWGIGLNGFNASPFMFLSFKVRGERGGEQFEIGLKDRSGIEKKIQSNSYFDATTEWQAVQIPLSSFAGVNLSALDTFNLGFNETHGGGVITIDEIAFTSEAQGPTRGTGGPGEAVARSTRVLVDGFERTNPYDVYVVREGDDSSLNLTSSRLVHDGDYSMEMEYSLSTEKPWGSWVVARWQNSQSPLDWTGVDTVKVWVQGDGSDNVFAINLFDADGEMWTYQDLNVMKVTKWTQLSVPVDEFALSNESKINNGVFDSARIQAYELAIMSKSSQRTSGRIWVDQFYVTGMGLSAVWAAPANVVEELRLEVPTIGNIDLSGSIYTEYFWNPEEKGKLFHWAKLIASAKTGNLSGRAEIATESQNFSDSAALVVVSTSDARSILRTQSPDVISPSIQIMANNLYSWLTNVTVGNVWFEYSKYTYSLPPLGGWGWKGITAQGDIDRLSYHVFYLSQPFDSYGLGTRWTAYWPDWKVAAYAVHKYESARVENAGQVNGGTLSSSNEWDVRPIFRDTVYSLELWRWFLDRQIQLNWVSGWNQFNQYATADYTDVFHPSFSQELPSEYKSWDSLHRAGAETNDLLVPGLQVALSYRQVGPEYKPYFRREPVAFDYDDIDQKGYNVRVTQRYEGWQFGAEYDDLTRISNSDYFKYRTRLGIGYYGFYGLDLALSYETWRSKYESPASQRGFSFDDDSKVSLYEIYLRSQLTQNLATWFKVQPVTTEDPNDPTGTNKFTTDWLLARLEYYVNSNARIFAEYKTTRYPQRSWEPKGYPFDDNYSRVAFEYTF